MEILQVYTDVPAIELGSEDRQPEIFAPYAPFAELSQYWRSIDPALHSRTSFDTYHPDTSAHLVNMEKYLLNLTNSAHGWARSLPADVSKHDSSPLGLSTGWGARGAAPRTIRYMSPNGPWGGSFSSTNSTPSDHAFSPDVSRHHASLFREDLDSQLSFGSHGTVPFPQSQYLYNSESCFSGQTVASPAPIEQTVACTMKELQYTPDLESQDALEENSCIRLETTRPKKMAPTPESCCLDVDTPSRSEDHDTIKDEDDEKIVESDVDPEYSPSRSQPSRRRPLINGHARSPTLSRGSVVRSRIETNSRIVKPPHKHPTSSKNKTKSASQRRLSIKKKGDSTRAFACSFSHYGCSSRFASKNEWKRHVSSQHLQLGFYRCDSGPCNPASLRSHSRTGGGEKGGYNDFNRKDLFTQHHRRMHKPWTRANQPPSKKANEEFEEGLEDVRQRCWIERRKAPRRSRCGFCRMCFEGESAWEERMEHIGKHFEKSERENKDLGEGEEDPELRRWALDQGIVVDYGDRGCWLDGLRGDQERAGRLTTAGTRRGQVTDGIDVDEDAIGDDE